MDQQMEPLPPAKLPEKGSILPLVVATLGALYVVSPIDLVPDFIPVVGWIEDIAVASVAIAYTVRRWDSMLLAIRNLAVLAVVMVGLITLMIFGILVLLLLR